jgi:hypothetical protein
MRSLWRHIFPHVFQEIAQRCDAFATPSISLLSLSVDNVSWLPPFHLRCDLVLKHPCNLQVELGKKKSHVGVVLEGAEAGGPPLEPSETDATSPTRNHPSGSVVRRAGGTVVGTCNANTAGAGRYNIQWIADPTEPAR